MFSSIREIRAANAARGHHFFESGTIRFFNSRILSGVHAGRYFITSECYCDHRTGDCNPRMYTIRRALDSGAIETVGEFQQYETAESARRAMRQLD